MTAQQLAELDQWLDQYADALVTAEAGAVAATWAAYSAVDDWYDPAQTVAAAAAAMGTAEAIRSTHAGLIGEFLALAMEISGQARVRPVRLVPDYGRAADPFAVYSRPVFEFRDAVARGLSEELALIEAQQRAEVISLTDALLARRDASRPVMKAAGVTKYRRVIRPELSKTGTCGLCIAAATQLYGVDDLLPIHSLCKCTVLPVTEDVDPKALNTADLDKLYEGMGSTDRQRLTQYRYQVGADGELGPVLEPKRTQTRGSGRTEATPQERARAELAALEPRLAVLEQRAAAGENVAAPLAYQRDRIAKLRAALT